MGLSARHIGELVDELAALCVGWTVREVQPHPPRDLLLILEREPQTPIVRLRISADREAGRLHLQCGPVHRHAGTTGPFYRQIGAELAGARLEHLERLGNDRIARLRFETAASKTASDSTRRWLVAELTGRHANLLYLDETEQILSVLDPPSPQTPAAQRLSEGRRYLPPPGRAPDRERDPSLAESLPEPPPASAGKRIAERAPLSWRVEASLGREADERHAGEIRKQLVQRLQRRLKAAKHLLAGLEEKANAASKAERVRQDGELLSAHRHLLRRGLSEIELEDAYDPEAPLRRIQLDPKRTPQENVAKLFARYKKLLRSQERLPAEVELAQAAHVAVSELLERARHAGAADPTDAGEALDIEAEAIAGGWLTPRQVAPQRRKKARNKPEPRLPYHRFRGLRGSEIRVGRSARDNDELTLKVSRGNDLWFHTANAPGSHVVLVVPKGSRPDPEEVIDAAHLALHFSPLEGARRADIHVAPCKLVKKPKRAPAGLVTLSGGETKHIRVEEERLERLLATRRAVPGQPR